MAGSGFLNAALDELAASLGTITGLPVARDPRNITPGCVLIDAPTFEAFNYRIVKLTVPCLLISSGPGNQDALDQLLGIAADVMAKQVGVIAGRPINVSIGGTDAPAFELTVVMEANA